MKVTRIIKNPAQTKIGKILVVEMAQILIQKTLALQLQR